MAIVNVHQAKTQLSRLLERVEAGEEVIIARAGKPAAKLVPFVRPATERVSGAWRGQLTLSADFDQLPDDVLAAFEGDLS